MKKNERGSTVTASPLADEAARRAIREELGTTLLVEAAAGTGKTESLVERMVGLIRTGRATVDRLSAVTFTIKAAAELSQRFQSRLEGAARGARSEERERLVDALARLDTAFIGTIHAFCARLLRERPVEAGVDPGFEEMEQPEDEVARQEAWERHAERLFATESPLLPRLSALGMRLDDLHETFEQMCENEDVLPEVPPESPPPDFTAPRRAVWAFLRRAEANLPETPPPGGWGAYQDAVRRALRLESLLSAEEPAAFVEVMEALDRARSKSREAGPLAIPYEALCRDVLTAALQAWREHRYPVALAVVVPAVLEYAAWRRRQGRLNFQDLLLLARNLLRDHPQVRRDFQQRFLPILVDEFQDTDPIQAEILFYLTGRDVAERDWRAAVPLDGSLFVVGDPKQSIYRFRRADILTYGLVRERIERSGRVLRLSTNFRSTGRLCAWINGAFRELFPSEATPQQAAFVPLEPHREEGGPGVFRLGVHTTSAAVAGMVEQDATRVARAIARAVASGVRRPGDFLVLFRNRRYMSVYARRLETEGIPSELAGGGAFADSQELAALLPLLAALADPDDPVAWLAVLRGPLFGVDDEALYRFVRAGGRFTHRGDPPDGADPRIARAVALAREADDWTSTMPSAAAISRVCERLGWIAYAASRELGDSRAGNLLKALATARRFSAEGLDFAGVVAELTRMTGGGYIEEMNVEPGRRDAVRLLTVHGAKGLEAPVVFLADPRADRGRPPRFWIERETEPARSHWQISREAGDFKVIAIAQPLDWQAMAEREKEFDEAEKTRLLYVAATRAREMLVVSTWRQGKGAAKGTWAAFDARLKEELAEGPALELPQAVPPDFAAALTEFRAARADRLASSAKPTYAVASVTALAHAAGEKPAWESTGRGLTWGRVLHAVLEAAMREDESAQLPLALVAANALAEEERAPGELDDVLRIVEAVRGSPLWSRARAARRRLVEVPFSLRVAPEEIGLTSIGAPADTLLQGAIDLVFEEDDGWVLIDYKSDAVTPQNRAQLVAFYEPQIAMYRRYWERLTGRPTRAGIFFIQGGETVWMGASTSTSHAP
ncbi:MAG TPA: UvrD-helicase domain-containing protein [Thermoanaerobaculia bacterium]